MASTVRRIQGAPWRLGLVVAVLAVVVQSVSAQDAVGAAAAFFPDPVAPDTPVAPHVRGLDGSAAALLQRGQARSATLRRLVQTLDSSDVIVFVGTGLLRAPGQMIFLTASPGARFLRITISVPQLEPRLLALLGHELQHAVEVGSAPEIISAARLGQYYRNHGELGNGGWCTRAAQKATAAVAYEVARSKAE